MSQQRPGPRRFLPTARRRWAVIDAVAMLGLLAGTGYAALRPPMFTSTAVVGVFPPGHDMYALRAQVPVVTSDPVLAGALRRLDPGASQAMLRGALQVNRPASELLSISTRGRTAGQAERTAEAVAFSYVGYVNSASGPDTRLRAEVLTIPMNATGTSASHRLLVTGGLGALVGALIGAIGAIALRRGSRSGLPALDAVEGGRLR